jgi:hypothetical protein
MRSAATCARNVRNVHIVWREGRGVGSGWPARWAVQERGDPGEGPRPVVIDRLSAAIGPE